MSESALYVALDFSDDQKYHPRFEIHKSAELIFVGSYTCSYDSEKNIRRNKTSLASLPSEID